MPDILNAAQKTPEPVPLLPAGLDLPYASHGTTPPPEPEPAVPPPAPKKRSNKALLIAVFLFLFATLPLSVYFVSQQRQIADIRNRAAGPCKVSKNNTTDTYCDNGVNKTHSCIGGTCSDDPSSICGTWGSESSGGACGGGTTTSSTSDTSSQTTTTQTTTTTSTKTCSGQPVGACSKDGNGDWYKCTDDPAWADGKWVRDDGCGSSTSSTTTTSTTTPTSAVTNTGGGASTVPPTDDCWKDNKLGMFAGDVGCTPGAQQCNGNILAECQPEISRFCKVSYWKAIGTCSGGTPMPYAGVTVSPNFGQNTGRTADSGSCGGNGQSCCDPFSTGGKICDGNLYCNTASGKCESSKPTNLCQGNQGSKEQAGDLCEVFICPGKCDNGNQCTKSTGKVPCGQANLGGQCGQIDWLDANRAYCGVKVQNCGGACAGTTQTRGGQQPDGQQQQPPPPATPTPTPTPTPLPPGPQCKNIKLYKGNEVVLPSSLVPGDQITVAIVGANATKARARVNGSSWTETSTKNAAGEFTIQFTIPASGGTFTIEAEVYQNGVWQ